MVTKVMNKLVGVRLPVELIVLLKETAKREDCSMSWIVTEALMGRLGVTQDLLDKNRGYSIPKTYTERKRNPYWSPHTKASKEKREMDNDGE